MLSESLAHIEFKLVNFTDFNKEKLTSHLWVFQEYVAYNDTEISAGVSQPWWEQWRLSFT